MSPAGGGSLDCVPLMLLAPPPANLGMQSPLLPPNDVLPLPLSAVSEAYLELADIATAWRMTCRPSKRVERRAHLTTTCCAPIQTIDARMLTLLPRLQCIQQHLSGCGSQGITASQTRPRVCQERRVNCKLLTMRKGSPLELPSIIYR
jgi:hypothetical protein